jgi:hypothetical protein
LVSGRGQGVRYIKAFVHGTFYRYVIKIASKRSQFVVIIGSLGEPCWQSQKSPIGKPMGLSISAVSAITAI